MSDLHEKLLALIDEYTTSMQADDYPATWPLAALRAVVELHAPMAEMVGDRLAWHSCKGCDAGAYAGEPASWPCSTIQAIARELGVDG